jgi:predicted short-subunit dehydrogenase-like oxidoreductase (DUF2520 family)
MNFSIAGTGNAAHHFAMMLTAAGHRLIQVYARQLESAARFADRYGAMSIEDPSDFYENNDLVIVAVSDQAIEQVCIRVPRGLLVVHTSGATPLSVIPHERRGVIWPLQTLSEAKDVDYATLPLCMEASDQVTAAVLSGWFSSISNAWHEVSGMQRQALHMAAVWSCNFTNYCYRVAQQICREHKLPAHLLQPLIEETAFKLQSMTAKAAQTGPAERGDLSTIRIHLDLLEEDEIHRDLYRTLSELIMNNRYSHEL